MQRLATELVTTWEDRALNFLISANGEARGRELFKRYESLAEAASDVLFVGRLATYRYYNMDQVVGQALTTFDHIRSASPAAPPARGPEARGRAA